jgi:hypothetical protein
VNVKIPAKLTLGGVAGFLPRDWMQKNKNDR